MALSRPLSLIGLDDFLGYLGAVKARNFQDDPPCSRTGQAELS